MSDDVIPRVLALQRKKGRIEKRMINSEHSEGRWNVVDDAEVDAWMGLKKNRWASKAGGCF